MPEQHDPLEELARFGAGLHVGPGGAMPRTAADVRRRGDQIRHRRTALVSGAAALAVAAVAVPIFVVAGNNTSTPGQDRDRVAGNGNGQGDGQATAATLTAEDLLRDSDTEYELGRMGAYRTTETFEGDGQATYHRCQRATTSSLGATSSFTRTWDYIVPLEPGDTAPEDLPGDGLTEIIAQFPDEDTARAAYETWQEWMLACEDRFPDADRGNVHPQARSADLPQGSDGVLYDMNWTLEPEEKDPFGETSYINETGLALQGDRIAVVSVTIIGLDYNWLDEDGGTPVHRMLATAAERLEPDA